MEHDRTPQFTPVDHPDTRVRRIGFALSDPYVEHCWSAVIGPSSTLLLRRLPTLWIARVPAETDAGELSRSLGLGAGDRSRLASTLERLVNLGLARPAADGAGLEVYRQVPPLTQRGLARLPEWTRDAEDRLLGAHLTQIDDSTRHHANVVSITARLDRLQHRPGPRLDGPTHHGPGIA